MTLKNAVASTLLRFILLLNFINFGSALTYKGADISSAKVVENSGITYKDVNGNSGALETILKNNGMNLARIRIWTAGTYSTAYALALAKVCPAAFSGIVDAERSPASLEGQGSGIAGDGRFAL
jgi:hypothetical protein